MQSLVRTQEILQAVLLAQVRWSEQLEGVPPTQEPLAQALVVSWWVDALQLGVPQLTVG
jgi:hypothetical protein